MKIEQRGVPPYTIMSAALTEIRAHPAYRDDFLGALDVIFDLTNAGTDQPGPQQVAPECIIDSTGTVVFSAGNQSDILLLQQIDKVGIENVEIITSNAG